MPLPTNPIKEKKTGPAPICICGICSVCKNRERQRRWYERQKIERDLGIALTEEEALSMFGPKNGESDD